MVLPKTALPAHRGLVGGGGLDAGVGGNPHLVSHDGAWGHHQVGVLGDAHGGHVEGALPNVEAEVQSRLKGEMAVASIDESVGSQTDGTIEPVSEFQLVVQIQRIVEHARNVGQKAL